MISFNQIPANLYVPGDYAEIDPTKAYNGLSGIPTKVLVIGQKLAAAPGTENVPHLITQKDQSNALFGRGSMLAHMMEKFLTANKFTEVHAIAQLDNGAGVAAVGSIAFNGAATAAGTLNLYIGGRRVQVGIASADADTVQATKTAAAINANIDLAVTAVVDGIDTKKVNITSRHKGECGNDIMLILNYNQDETTPAGMTTVIVPMTGGTGNPNVATVLAAIGDTWYTDFAMAYSDTANIALMEAELTDRFSALGKMDAHCFIGEQDTHGALMTKGQGRNSPHVSIIGEKGAPNPPYEWAAVLAAISSYHIKIDPARPLKTLILTGLLAPKIAERFTFEERNLLLQNGISTFVVDAGGSVVIERIITTYRLNSFGASDPSYLNMERLKTLTYIRYDWRNHLALQFPRYKLADDGTRISRGQAIVTPSILKAAMVSRFIKWEEAGLVEGLEQFKAEAFVERDANDRDRANFFMPVDIINQLLVTGTQVQFKL